jgi:folate-binding protein YgfZ
MSQNPPEFHAWRPATWLQVSGPDAFTFLQGQFSNDLRGVEQTGAVYGLWLNQKGRVLADSFVLRVDSAPAYWVGSYFSPAAIVRERLESHLIADDVQIEDQTDRWHGLTVFGADRPASAAGDAGISFPGRRGNPAWELMTTHEPVLPAGTALSASDMEVRRLTAGVPAVPADIGPGDLPQEGGLEATAVSFNKGCYLGQEVMARLHAMGTPRRRLFRVAGQGPVVAAGSALLQEGRAIGELRSAVATGTGWIGLAMFQLAHLKAEQPVSGAGTEMRVLA